jgi:hypothetical protein
MTKKELKSLIREVVDEIHENSRQSRRLRGSRTDINEGFLDTAMGMVKSAKEAWQKAKSDGDKAAMERARAKYNAAAEKINKNRTGGEKASPGAAGAAAGAVGRSLAKPQNSEVPARTPPSQPQNLSGEELFTKLIEEISPEQANANFAAWIKYTDAGKKFILSGLEKLNAIDDATSNLLTTTNDIRNSALKVTNPKVRLFTDPKAHLGIPGEELLYDITLSKLDLTLNFTAWINYTKDGQKYLSDNLKAMDSMVKRSGNNACTRANGIRAAYIAAHA